jgi:hypothetical protein
MAPCNNQGNRVTCGTGFKEPRQVQAELALFNKSELHAFDTQGCAATTFRARSPNYSTAYAPSTYTLLIGDHSIE